MTNKVSGRVLVRVLVIVFFAAANLGPILLSFLLQRQDIANWPPVVAPFQFQRGPTFVPPWILLSHDGVGRADRQRAAHRAFVREVARGRGEVRAQTGGCHAASVA